MSIAPDLHQGHLLSHRNQIRSLRTILLEEFGVPFLFFGSHDAVVLTPENPSELMAEDPDWIRSFGSVEQSAVTQVAEGSYRLAVSLHEGGRPAYVAIGLKSSVARPNPETIREETSMLEKWLRAVFERLRLAVQAECRHRAALAKPAAGADAWEVIVRLEQLMRVQKTHKEPFKNRKRVLRSAAELVAVRSLFFVPIKADDPVITVGEELLSSWDSSQLATQLSRTVDWEEAGYVIINDMATTGWASRFAQVGNLLAFPVLDGVPIGWLIAINKMSNNGATGSPAEGRNSSGRCAPGEDADARVVPFRRTDAAMLAPFASLLGYHARASQSYSHLREILVGLTRSLTAAIDAKDSYTFGHSERVARIAVELGREMGLPEDELSDIYLAGLLHDIGKIGIRDEVLGKPSRLTSDEFEHIKDHVKIGHRILSGVNSISHLLPGVLYHHENFDGSGYPEGLKGNSIPFLARILAVADGYDAMSTSRPYRVALPREQVEQILIEGADKQWDKSIVESFTRSKHRIHAIRQRGVGVSLYGAIDDALCKGNNHPFSSLVSILNN
jgi:HD-GYP domain-containing protein (c-di-GMP phosphodiesterase class II)